MIGRHYWYKGGGLNSMGEGGDWAQFRRMLKTTPEPRERLGRRAGEVFLVSPGENKLDGSQVVCLIEWRYGGLCCWVCHSHGRL